MQFGQKELLARQGEPHRVSGMGLINSKNGIMQCPHLDEIGNRGGWVLLVTLDGPDSFLVYTGENPSLEVQRSRLGVSAEQWDAIMAKWPQHLKGAAPLLQSKDSLLKRFVLNAHAYMIAIYHYLK